MIIHPFENWKMLGVTVRVCCHCFSGLVFLVKIFYLSLLLNLALIPNLLDEKGKNK